MSKYTPTPFTALCLEQIRDVVASRFTETLDEAIHAVKCHGPLLEASKDVLKRLKQMNFDWTALEAAVARAEGKF